MVWETPHSKCNSFPLQLEIRFQNKSTYTKQKENLGQQPLIVPLISRPQLSWETPHPSRLLLCLDRILLNFINREIPTLSSVRRSCPLCWEEFFSLVTVSRPLFSSPKHTFHLFFHLRSPFTFPPLLKSRENRFSIEFGRNEIWCSLPPGFFSLFFFSWKKSFSCLLGWATVSFPICKSQN